MNKEDLLKILESFPGKKEVKQKVPCLAGIPRLNFLKIATEIKRDKPRISLGNDEDLWVKYIVFENFAISDLILVVPEVLIWDESDVFSPQSMKISRKICQNFFNKSEGKIEVFTASGIQLDELHEFLQTNNLF